MSSIVERYNKYISEESTDKTIRAQQKEDEEISNQETALRGLIDFTIEDENVTFDEILYCLQAIQALMEVDQKRLDGLIEKLIEKRESI